MEREHEKTLIALEQEIEGWKSANRILKDKLEIAEKALERISEEIPFDDHHTDIAAKALQQIRE